MADSAIIPLFLLVEARWGQSVFTKINLDDGTILRVDQVALEVIAHLGDLHFLEALSSSSNSSISSFGGGGFSKWGVIIILKTQKFDHT